jgi:ribosomal protein L22
MATAIQASTQIEGIAKARYARVSPQKARLVIDLIRGKNAEEALHTLRFTKKRVAKDIEKTLRSRMRSAKLKIRAKRWTSISSM